MFRILPHTADIRVKASGASLEELFTSMLTGMFAAMKPQHPTTNYQLPTTRAIHIESLDREALLVDFLNEALYLGETNREVYKDVKFSKFTDPSASSGQAELEAELIGRPRESVGVQVKAATYHGLKIEERGGELEAVVIFDI